LENADGAHENRAPAGVGADQRLQYHATARVADLAQASQPAAGTATAPVPAPPVAPADNPAQRLLSEAAAACGAGDTAGGLITLDRALRIAPRHAGLYAAMARCHALAGNAEAAAAAAERGLLYCRGAECRALARYADD
jgi:hypothetical protein